MFFRVAFLVVYFTALCALQTAHRSKIIKVTDCILAEVMPIIANAQRTTTNSIRLSGAQSRIEWSNPKYKFLLLLSIGPRWLMPRTYCSHTGDV